MIISSEFSVGIVVLYCIEVCAFLSFFLFLSLSWHIHNQKLQKCAYSLQFS